MIAVTKTETRPRSSIAQANRAAAMWMIKRMVVDKWDVEKAGTEAARKLGAEFATPGLLEDLRGRVRLNSSTLDYLDRRVAEDRTLSIRRGVRSLSTFPAKYLSDIRAHRLHFAPFWSLAAWARAAEQGA